MSDPNIVNPGESSYSLPQPTTTPVGDVPGMPMERVLPRQTSTGTSRGVQQLGSPNVFVDAGSEQIIVAKTDGSNVTTKQVLMGNQTNFGEGFYVTKPGIDVTSAKSADDFIFNSNQNVFKIVKTGFLTIPGFSVAPAAAGNYNSNSSFVQEPTGLNYLPAVIGYYTSVPSTSYLPLPFSNFTGTGVTASWFSVDVQVYNQYVAAEASVMVYGNFSYTQPDIIVKYYLLQESLSSS